MKRNTIRGIHAIAIGVAVILAVPAFGAGITGTIVFEGPPPETVEIKMDTDLVCSGKHTAPINTETVVLGEGQTLANVLVHITGGLPDKEYPIPEAHVVLNQVGCVYVPHVLAVRAGQTLDILNPDGTLHNVHAMTRKNPGFNMAMPKFKKKATKVFEEEEPCFQIKCDVHNWMIAWCAVLSHPFFDVTEKDGKFSLEGLDPGTYEVEAWHEKFGVKTQTVTVGQDDTKSADFSFSNS